MVDLDDFLRQPGAGVLRINIARNGKFFGTLHMSDERIHADAWGDSSAEILEKLRGKITPVSDDEDLLI